MTDDLVKRLRSANDESFVETLCGEAADRIEQLTTERDRLALAICGGEDAPGYANAQTVETLEHVAKQNQQAHGATINSLLAAEAENARLREDLEELDFLRHEGGPDSVAAMEAELKRLRAVLSDIKTASVCSVSRNVAASALGEAAA